MLGLAIFLSLRSAKVQTVIARKIIEKFEDKTQAKVELGLIKARLSRKISIEDLIVFDQLGDTLLSAPLTTLTIRNLDFKQSRFRFGKIMFYEPFIYLQEDPAGGLNISYILNSFESDTSKPAPQIEIASIGIKQARFRFNKFLAQPVPDKFSPNYISISKADVTLKDFFVGQDSIGLRLSKFSGLERSGFELNDMSGLLGFSAGSLILNNLSIKTPQSHLVLDQLIGGIDKMDSLAFFKGIQISAEINSGTLMSEKDLSFFIADYQGVGEMTASGQVSFSGSEINWEDAQLDYGDLTGFSGKISISNLGPLAGMEFNVDVESLRYNPQFHNESLLALAVNLDTLNIPIDIDSVGNLNFEGSFRGGMSDFITQGSFQSDYGEIMGYVITTKVPETDSYQFKGAVVGNVYDLKEFLRTKLPADSVKFDARLFGDYSSMTKHAIDANIHVYQAGFNDYTYQDIAIDGSLIDQRFEGSIRATDDNLDLNLNASLMILDSLPVVDFRLALVYADLAQLNFNRMDSIEILGLNMNGHFKGTGLDDIIGEIWVNDSYYQNSRGALPFDLMNLSIVQEFGQKRINLVSDYVDARLFGNIHLAELLPQIIGSGKQFLPVNLEVEEYHQSRKNDFTFNINLKNPRPLTEKLTPEIVFRENTSLSGFFKEGGESLFFEGIIPQFLLRDKLFTGFNFTLEADKDSVHLNGGLQRVQFNSLNKLENLTMDITMVPDQLNLNVGWKAIDSVINEGFLAPTLRFEPGTGTWPKIYADMPATEITYKDTVWGIDPFNLILDQGMIRFDTLSVRHNNESIMVTGAISDQENDTLFVGFRSMNLAHLETITGENKRFSFRGVVNGEAKVFDLYQKGLFLADLSINGFTVNNELLGRTRIISNRQADSDEIFMAVTTNRGEISTLGLSGFFNPVTDKIIFDLNLDKLRMNVFNAVLDPVLQDIRGIASGSVSIRGTRSDPSFFGEINLQKAGFNVGELNTRYTFTHPVKINSEGFWVENLIARDKEGNEGIVNGGVFHNKFNNLRLDFKLDVTRFLCMDTNEAISDLYWGKAYATGAATIAGPLKNIRIDVNARTESGTDFSVPVSKSKNVRMVDFIKYVEKEQDDQPADLISYTESEGKDYNVDLSGLELNLDIDVTPQARAQIIIDSQSGDVIRAFGRGNLNIQIDTRGVFSLSGEYLIDQGNYQFTLQNMPLKRFEIEPGGSVLFNGPIEDARIDIDANYKTNAALYDLILDETNPDLRQRTPVECHLLMSERLENPTLEFEIVLPPNGNDIARSQLANLAQDEINKQVLSLLILNQFSPLPGISSGNPRSYEGAGITTTTEVLSNQLNYLLSQITNDFDIGFNYLPGDELTSDEVAVALRAQLLENRMIINVNGNVDVRSVETDANQLVGDVEVEYKITQSGKLRVKAFTRANDRLLYEYSQYTQGVGIFFREEFDSFNQLLNKYWSGLTNTDSKNTKKE